MKTLLAVAVAAALHAPAVSAHGVAPPVATGLDAATLRLAGQGEGKVSQADALARVRKIVIEHLGLDAAKVTEDASFVKDLGADSLDTVELIMALEEDFSCEINDATAETMVTVGDAVRFLQGAKECK